MTAPGFKGGQGRSARDVEDAAGPLFFTALLAFLLFLLLVLS